MKKEIFEFINENLSLFNGKARLRTNTIFKTQDGKQVYTRVVDKISREFVFDESSGLLNFFSFSQDINELKKRQEFFKSLKSEDNSFLKALEKPKAYWKPKYEVIVATEDEALFVDLQKLGCPVRFITSEEDVKELENCDVVQVLDCDSFSLALESLPQSVVLNSMDEVYLERYLEIVSGWKRNLRILAENKIDEETRKLVDELVPLMRLAEDRPIERITREQASNKLDEINDRISERLKTMSISGDKLVELLNKKIPRELEIIMTEEIKKSGIPENLFSMSMPLSLDERELERFLKNQQADEHTSMAEAIKKNARLLKEVPQKLRELENRIIYFDFCSGVSRFMQGFSFPEFGQELELENSKNIFLENPQPVSFRLDDNSRCSILTGANSGGKTTLLEHVIQIIVISGMGMGVSGKARIPVFSEVYYFAKNKGSMSKGAFETLLGQMAEIKTGRQTLILADEMEAVTEPGVAGKIVNATAEYFINKNCFLVIATHLGQEISKHLPRNARVDGIEATGLDENFELVVNHNPVLGKIASSTPELIVEKLANTRKEEYFSFIHEFLKR